MYQKHTHIGRIFNELAIFYSLKCKCAIYKRHLNNLIQLHVPVIYWWFYWVFLQWRRWQEDLFTTSLDWCAAQRERRCRYCFYIRRGVWNQPGKGTDATRGWECLFNVTEGVTFKYRRCRITWFVRLGESPIVGEWSKMSIVLLHIPPFSSCRFSNHRRTASTHSFHLLFIHLWAILKVPNAKIM